MSGYINKLLEVQKNYKRAETPYTKQLFNNRNIELLDDEGQTRMRSNIAKVLYLAKRVRPDLLLATSVLTSRVNKYNRDDEGKLERIFNYINNTKDMELKLYDNIEGDEVILKIYVDASYGAYDDGKGQSAYGFSLGEGMFLVKSKKQKVVGKSSTGAEVIAIDDAACEGVHLMNVLKSCGYKCRKAIMNEDNISAIKIVNGGIESMNKTKFMRVRIAHVKEMIEQEGIEVVHCPTNSMIVDILTKPISGNQFKKLRDQMLGCE